MNIDLETLKRLDKDIRKNIKDVVNLQKERLYKEFSKNNLFLKKNILLNCIARAKIQESTNGIQDTSGYITILDDVPNSYLTELLNYIDVILENEKEYFNINILETGRYDLIFKGLLHNIKLLNLNLQNQEKTFGTEINSIKIMSLKNTIELYFSQIIDNAITFCKCYEADTKNNKMCKEVLNKEFTSHYKYQYKLDHIVTQKFKTDIHLIITNLENKLEYTKNMNGKIQLSMIHLSDTMSFAEKTINEIIDRNKEFKTKSYLSIIKKYKQIFINSKKRFQNSKMTNSFLAALKKSKMLHRMPYKQKIIYPFVYDILVMGFVYAVNHLKNKEIYADSNSLLKIVDDNKYKYLDKSSDDNYYYNEFIAMGINIPKEYKLLDEPMIVMIKYYSEFLDCKYEAVADVLRQLRFESAANNKSVYSLLQDQRNIQLGLNDDYFRKLSLYII